MEMTTPPPPSCGSNDCSFMSNYGIPSVFWNPVIDMAIALQSMHKQNERADKKRADIKSLIPHSTKLCGVCLIGSENFEFGGYWTTLDDVPDWVFVYVDDTIYDPYTGVLMLETGSPIIES